jgi:hypothetical protein
LEVEIGRSWFILRHRLPGGWLRSIEDRFESPQISVAQDLRNDFAISKETRRPISEPACREVNGKLAA